MENTVNINEERKELVTEVTERLNAGDWIFEDCDSEKIAQKGLDFLNKVKFTEQEVFDELNIEQETFLDRLEDIEDDTSYVNSVVDAAVDAVSPTLADKKIREGEKNEDLDFVRESAIYHVDL